MIPPPFPSQVEGSDFLRGNRALLADTPGSGKALAAEELVQTPLGPMTIASLSVGDQVLCPDGSVSQVTGVYPQGVQPLFRVLFTGGAEVRATGDHLWVTQTRRGRRHCKYTRVNGKFMRLRADPIPGEARTTATIARTLREDGGRNHSLRSVSPFDGEKTCDDLIDPWCLGVILGDGALTGQGTSLCAPDIEIAERFAEHFRLHRPNETEISYTVTGLVPISRQLNIRSKSVDKVIPASYLYNASAAGRLSLLQGLMDTDGYANPIAASAEYSSSSEVMVKQVQWLVESLGGSATLGHKPAPQFTYKGQKRTGAPNWRLYIRMPVNPFWLQRKAADWDRTDAGRQRYMQRMILDVLPDGEGEAVCISIDHPEREFLTRHHVPTHNSRTALDAAEGRTLVVAPARYEGLWADQVSMWTPELDYEFTSYHKLSERVDTEQLDGSTRRLATKQLNKGLRGYWDSVIVDEAHYLKNHRAKWTGSFEKLAKQSGQMSLLTGTPIPNWGHEIWECLRLIYGFKPGSDYSSYWRWIEKWFAQEIHPHTGRMSVITGLHPGISWEMFAEQLRGHYLRRVNPVDLPAFLDTTIVCPMLPKQRKAYRQMKAELLAEIDGQTVVSWSSGSAYTQMLKMCTGLDAVSDVKCSGKLDMLQEIMVDRVDTPTLLFGQYHSSLAAIQARLPGSQVIHGGVDVPERERIMAAWKAGEFPHLIGSYGTIAEGFTFNEADCVIRVEATPKASLMEQASFRNRRAGQTCRTFLIDLVTEDSVDARLHELIKVKSDTAMEFLKAADLL